MRRVAAVAGRLPAAVPVAVELGAPLGSLASDSAATSAIGAQAAAAINRLLDELGLPGEALVQAQGVDSSRPLRVRVHGRLEPFPPDVLIRVWKRVAPPELRSYPDLDATPVGFGFPAAWLASFAGADREGRDELLTPYIVELTLAVVRGRPSSLVGTGQAAEYWRDDSAGRARASSLDHAPAFLVPALGALLDMGFSLADRDTIRREVAGGGMVEDVVERAVVALRPGRVEIHAHLDYVDQLFPGSEVREPISIHDVRDEKVQEGFRVAAEALFNEYGVRLHDAVLVPSARVAPGALAIKVNDWLGDPVPGLQVGRILVNAPVEWLMQRGLQGAEVSHPMTGEEVAVGPASIAPAVEAEGIETWTLGEYAVLVLRAELGRLTREGKIHCLFGVDDVEFELSRLTQAWPALVEAAARRYSPREITTVLRRLLSEGVPIRDLRTILTALVELTAMSPEAVAAELLDGADGMDPNDRPTEYVRTALRYVLSFRYAGMVPHVYALRVDPGLEARAARGLADADEEGVRDKVWRRLAHAGQRDWQPVVLASASARRVVRKLLAPEFPALAVLTEAELRPGLIPFECGVLKAPPRSGPRASP